MPNLRASWYSQLPPFGWFDKEDRPGSNALGVPDWQQGIALPSRRTLGQWYNVTPPGGGLPFSMQQTDVGPAKWTGRGVDISAAGAHQMGYTPQTFPTDAEWKIEPRDEPRGLGSPAGLPVQAGDLPDNAVADAYAAGPTTGGRRMPTSLMDMFTPTSATTGQPIGFNDAIAQNRNSLIGLGMGMLQPRSLAVGAPVGSAWTSALGGYQQGAQTDAANAYRQAQLAHQKTQEARQAAQDAFNRQMAEKQFAQSTLTPYQKMQSDLARAKGTPDEQAVTDYYAHAVPPPQSREVQIGGQNVIQEFDPRTRQWKTATTDGGATAAADPFTTGGGGVSYGQGAVGPRGFGSGTSGPAYPGATAGVTQGQPVQPPKKPLTAHEQTAIDEADKALQANQNAIGNLQYAKQLSKKAASGPFALERGQAGSWLGGGIFSEGGKETVMLHNTIINNAVDQLKATFGGNPSEGERKILLEMAGSINASDDVRQEIYNRGIKLAKEKLAENARRAQQIRGGTYYQPGGGATGGSAAQRPSGAVRRYNPETGNIE